MAGVQIHRMMVKSSDGTEEQFFPQSHVDAIIGLESLIQNGVMVTGVTSINGKKGDVTLSVLTDTEYLKIKNFIDNYVPNNSSGSGSSENISNDELSKIRKIIDDYENGLLGSDSHFILEKVDEVDVK